MGSSVKTANSQSRKVDCDLSQAVRQCADEVRGKVLDCAYDRRSLHPHDLVPVDGHIEL